MKKILVIEDDEDIGDIVEMILSGKYEMTVAKSAGNIVDVYMRCMPDLILLDNFVGQFNAADIISMLKLGGCEPLPPFILFSAASDIRERSFEMHAAAYLPKPFNISDLLGLVGRVLTAYSGQQTSGQGTDK